MQVQKINRVYLHAHKLMRKTLARHAQRVGDIGSDKWQQVTESC